MEKKNEKKQLVHILAGEVRVKTTTTDDDKLNIRLSWSPKGVQGENPPHGSNYEK